MSIQPDDGERNTDASGAFCHQRGPGGQWSEVRYERSFEESGVGRRLGRDRADRSGTRRGAALGRGWGGITTGIAEKSVVAGALLGGILGLGYAAIASSNRPRYVDRGYYYDRGYDPYYVPLPPAVAHEYQDYRPRCWNDWRWDPYWGRNVKCGSANWSSWRASDHSGAAFSWQRARLGVKART
jgi:hypothetical protein